MLPVRASQPHGCCVQPEREALCQVLQLWGIGAHLEGVPPSPTGDLTARSPERIRAYCGTKWFSAQPASVLHLQ